MEHQKGSLLNDNQQTPGSALTDFDPNIFEFRGNQNYELREKISSTTVDAISEQRDKRSPFVKLVPSFAQIKRLS